MGSPSTPDLTVSAMVRTQGKVVLSLGACAAAALLRSTAFVPPPSVKSHRVAQLSTAACTAALLGAAENAHADAIGDAAAKLSKAAYPFMKEVPWNSYLYSTNPGSKDAVAWAKAIGKMIDMGAAMDTKLLKAGADAHHAAIGGLPASGVCPESKTMDVYNSVGALVDSKVPEYLMSTVKEADAKAAYAALVDFAGVVKANPITPSTPASTASGGSI